MTRRTLEALFALCLALLVVQGCKEDKPKKPKAGAGATGSSTEAPNDDGKAGGGFAGMMGSDGAGAGQGSGGGLPSGPSSCGNGHRDGDEECDDGNVESGDGCSYRCRSACETCERDSCPDNTPFMAHPWYSYAYQMEGDAEAGPKKGSPRSELVKSLMQCVYDAKCTIVFNNEEPVASQISLRECFCKNAPAGTPPATYPDVCKSEAMLERGPCLDQMLAAAETDSVETMLSKLTNLNLAIGRAFSLLQHCDARVCGGECLPKETGLQPTSTAEPAGAAGAGGTPAAGGASAEP